MKKLKKVASSSSKKSASKSTSKKKVDVASFSSKKSASKSTSKKKVDGSGRPCLPKGMIYRIDTVPAHPLYIDSLCNRTFGEDIKAYFLEDILGAFTNTIFGIFLDSSQCNWIRKISKCLLMLEIQQDNKDKIHVRVQGNILKFMMLEFAIITGLKYTSNIDEYMYSSSPKLALILKYFSDVVGGITRSKLITRVKMGNFDNSEPCDIIFCSYICIFSAS
ncbi:uncharacterized protein LOC124892781 [Capsicum annuum]|uniref:uncharacterized protein LOC124892781 n=1 Tax=Capsicum annuum TaxID=4072 RepID=UPI001FB0EF09|nr:uncharacterized protein LOC124892781 [Capsicum annuum]